MRFVLNFKLDGEAFDRGPDLRNEAIAQTLEAVAKQIRTTGRSAGKIIDENGKRVGFYEVGR